MWIVLVLLGLALFFALLTAWRDRRRRPGPRRGSHVDEGEAWAHHHASDISRMGGSGGM